METNQEKINMFTYHTLEPLGYEVTVLHDVGTALTSIAKDEPDLVLVDINLEGLSVKDLLVAIKFQNMDLPVIIIAEKGQESQVIQSFKLGGTDYLMWPAKETEIVSCIERSLIYLQENRAGQQLSEKLREAKRKLETSMNDMSTIIEVSKAIVSITDQKQLIGKIVEGIVKLSNADYGWMTLKNEKTNEQILVSQIILPDVWRKKLGQPMDDGIGALVGLSGESLSINGKAIQKFKVRSLGRAVTVCQ